MIRDFFNTIYARLAALVTPPFCAGCMLFLEEDTVFCQSCWRQVTPVAPLKLPVTPNKAITIYAIGEYAFPLKKLILGKNSRSIASSALLGKLAWQQTIVSALNFDYIVPIPLHWTRKAWRGFNQAEEIGAVIAQLSGKPQINLLVRHKKTKFQAECSKAERAYNIADAFSLRSNVAIKGKNIVLVDDLATTGVTLMHASKILYKAGAKSVIAVVGARVI